MVQLHPLAHAQFVGKAHRSETKFEKGASDRNSPLDEQSLQLMNTITERHARCADMERKCSNGTEIVINYTCSVTLQVR